MYPQRSEKQIETIALEFLGKWYKWNSSNRKVEAVSQQTNRHNRKVADGLIAFHQSRLEIFTASLEVKADINSRDLNLSFDEDRGRTIAYVGAGVLYIIFIALTYIEFGPPSFGMLWGIASYLIITTLYILLWNGIRKWQLPWIKKIDALKQLKQYPGNECWLAVGYFGRDFQNSRLQLLKKYCRKQGVGLLLVNPHVWQKPRVYIRPRYKSSPFAHSFLEKFYLNAKTVKAKIASEVHFPFQFLLWTRGQWKREIAPFSLPIIALVFFLPFAGTNKLQIPKFEASIHQNEGNYPEYEKPISVTPSNPQKESINPPCTPPSFRGERYLLADSMHKSREEAEERVALLKDYQLSASYFWLPCLKSDKTTAAYCVYTGQAFAKYEKAAYALDTYRFNLLAKGIEEVEEPFVLKAWQQ